MKKLLYLFVASIILISCNSNDNDETLDPIIGTWQLQSATVNNVEISNDCSKQSTIAFSDDNTIFVTSFDDFDGECTSFTETSTWLNTGNSVYEFDDEEELDIRFSQNNTVFTISETESTEEGTITIIISYKKI